VAATAAAKQPGAPGSSPSNPITEPNTPVAGPTQVHVWWPDGTSQTVYSDQAPSEALNQATISSLTAARRSGGVSPYVSWGGGASACSDSLYYPYKINSSTVGTAASVSCTSDVYSVGGTVYLWRSSNWTLIGSDTEHSNGQFANWSVTGGCLSSTWQYNASAAFSAISSTNGGVNWSEQAGPSWISC
jgi:hypothetical protein